MNKLVWGIFLGLFVISFASAASDVVVWQGQYYTGTTFNQGTYTFNFTIYDSLTGGSSCYTNISSITTGYWGQWKTEQNGVLSSCSNQSKDYYLNININGVDQSPRRRLTLIGNWTAYELTTNFQKFWINHTQLANAYSNSNFIFKNGSNSNITKLNFNNLSINTFNIGDLGWDIDASTLSLGMPYGATQQIGLEFYKEVTNLDSVTIFEGQAVSIVGASGNREAVRLTNASSTSSATAFIGIATTNILPN